MKKVLIWGFSIFCILCGFVYFPSFASVVFWLIGIASLPINLVRDLWKKLPVSTKIIKPVLITALFFVACGIAPATSTETENSATVAEQQENADVATASTVEKESQEIESDETLIEENKTSGKESAKVKSIPVESTEAASEPVPKQTVEPLPKSTPEKENIKTVDPEDTAVLSASFDINSIPAYSGNAYVAVNDNVPYLTDAEMQTASYEYYSSLDPLGRCGVCVASVGKDIMPTEERGEIGSVKPSGWNQTKYAGLVEGNFLYNRCHLIGYQLTGENANTKNLITGTRALNVDGMLPFENMVADYVKETENHVMYRVTPIFKGNDLLASGVLMEAKSVEDNGDGILFCVYCYNTQPGVTIDYSNGASALEGGTSQSSSESQSGINESTPPAMEPATTPEPEPESSAGGKYAVNSKNGKIHIVGECSATGTGDGAMTSPVYFNTYEEAEAYSIQIKPSQEKRQCGNCW